MCKTNKYGKGCGTKSIRIDYIENEVGKQLIFNNNELMSDYSKLINRTTELQAELQVLEQKVTEEKEHQNYLINNIVKIGQRKFDEKYDASQDYMNQMQERIDNINISLNNTNQYIKELSTVVQMKPVNGYLVPDIVLAIDKEVVRKVVERINIDNDRAEVYLINGNTFTINRLKP